MKERKRFIDKKILKKKYETQLNKHHYLVSLGLTIHLLTSCYVVAKEDLAQNYHDLARNIFKREPQWVPQWTIATKVVLYPMSITCVTKNKNIVGAIVAVVIIFNPYSGHL